MEILTVIVSLLIILTLSALMLMSIDRLSKDTFNKLKRGASQYVVDYDKMIEEKRKEMESLSNAVNKAKAKEDTSEYEDKNEKTYHKPLNIKKEETLSSADIYQILHNDYNFDAVKTAKEILENLPEINPDIKVIEGLCSKLDKATFAQLDTLPHEDQLSLLQEVLDENEFEVIKKNGKYGIDLYNDLETTLSVNKENVQFIVSSEKMKEELKKELNIDAIVSNELVEGMNVVVNNKVHKYGIERSELQ